MELSQTLVTGLCAAGPAGRAEAESGSGASFGQVVVTESGSEAGA